MAPERAGGDPTLRNTQKELTVDLEPCILELREASGMSSVLEQWISAAEGFVIVYSVASRASFESVSQCEEQIVRKKGTEHVPLLLLGNKCDAEELRVVSTAEGQKAADEIGARFFETSAKTGANVQEAFVELVRLIRSDQMRDPGPRSRHCIVC